MRVGCEGTCLACRLVQYQFGHVLTCADGCQCSRSDDGACRLRPGVPPDALAGWDNVSRLAEERQGVAVAADPGRALGRCGMVVMGLLGS